MIDHHYQETVRQLLRLHKNTPRCVLFFLAGCLPGAAMIHMRQLNLFGMICRMDPKNLLYQHARNYLSSAVQFKNSWFSQIRKWCLLYHLPHPTDIFEQHLSKEKFKSLIKKKVLLYWETVLREEASQLKSLNFFKPQFMSLLTPHPIWGTAGYSPVKVSMATIQALFLSGRYRCGALTRHWTTAPKSGSCEMSPLCSRTLEDVSHIHRFCPALNNVRRGLYDFTLRFSSNLPPNLLSLIRTKCNPDSPSFVSFVLDCSVDSDVIRTSQELGPSILEPIFTVTRTWAYVLHRERLKLLGRWSPVAY